MLSHFKLMTCGFLSLLVAPLATAQRPSLLTFNESVVQFNATGVGSTSSNYSYFYISNPGPNPVTITGFSVRGINATDFSVNAGYCPVNPYTLYPGGSCSPNLSFTPSAVGTRLAQMVVTVLGGAAQSVVLAGEGVAATKIVTFVPSETVFPATSIGIPVQNAPSAFVEVINSGNSPVSIQSVSVASGNAQDFQITSNYCTGILLSPNTYCGVYVAFVPTATGNRKSRLVVKDDATGGAQSLPLLGTGNPPVNMLQFFPAAVAFTPTATGGEQYEITVQNTGSESITLNGFAVTGQNQADFSLVQNYCQPIPYTLTPQALCFLWMQFTPQSVGVRVADLEVIDSAPGSPQRIPLEGTGLPPVPVGFTFSSNPLDFGTQAIGTTNFNAFLLITNTGSATVQLSLQIQGANASDFYVTNYCSTLYPNSPCFLPVTFTPSASGVRIANMVATDLVSGRSQALALIGSGVSSATPISAGGTNFTPVAVGSTSTSYLTIYDPSFASVTLSGFKLLGPAASDFVIFQNDCTGVLYYSCSLGLNFTPSASGARLAEIGVGDGSGPVSIPIGGFGLPSTRTISFNPTGVNFGTAPVGVPVSATANIVNTGSEPVTFDSLSLAGANSGDFAITGNQCPQGAATLAPGLSCQVTMQFTPSALGTQVARLQVADNASGSPQSLPLTGFGNNALPSLIFNPNTVNFSAVGLGSSQQQYVFVNLPYGAPSLPIAFNSIKIVGANASDFSLINNCGTSLPQFGCSVYVTFTPTVTGLRVASLQFTDNANGSPQIVPLAGTGLISQSLIMNPNPVAFAQSQAVGYESYPVTLTITNASTANVTLNSFHIGGRDAGDFGIQSSYNCPLSPAPFVPNQTCQLNIIFLPTATGTRIATLQVTSSVPGSPFAIGIVGEGVPVVKTLAANPTSLTFGPISVGSTEPGGPVNVTNSGTVPVNLNNVTITGANASDFSVTSNFCTYFGTGVLNPGSSCQLYMSFTPSATGTRNGQINVSSNASNSPLVVPLTGTGQ